MIHMLQTYRTVASFYAKIKYFSLNSTFDIDRTRPDKRTSLYFLGILSLNKHGRDNFQLTYLGMNFLDSF